MDLVTPQLGLMFWQTVLFIIVLIILGKYAWAPILGALKDRERTIEEALSSAQRAKEEMQKLQAANEALLQEARLERDKMLRDAQVAASNIVEESKSKATQESSRIIESARASIETEKKAALAEMKNLAATLSLDIAEKLLRKELQDEKAQKELVTEYLNEAKLN